MSLFGSYLTTAAWGLASGMAILILGMVTLTGGRSRPRGAFAFGLFGVVWGIHILAGGLLFLAASEPVATLLFIAFFASLLPLGYFLIEFAVAHAEEPYALRWRLLRVGAASLALLTALAFLLAPSLFFSGVTPNGGMYYAAWGPLYVPLVVVPHFGGFTVAMLALARAVRAAPTPRMKVRLATLLAGIGIYASFAAGNNLVFYALGDLLYPEYFVWTDVLLIAVLGALATVAASAGVSACRAARSAALPEDRSMQALLAACLLGPLAWGAAEGALVLLNGQSPFNTVGLWRLAGVGVIAYGLARWRFYDLPQRASRAGAAAAGSAVAAATGAAAYGAGTLVSNTPLLPVALGTLALAGAFVPSLRLAQRLFGRRVQAPEQHAQMMYGQRIDAYRAALEASLARGTLEEDEPFLAALRDRFDIAEAEDRVLRYYARSSVIVPRSQQAWDAYDRLRLLGEGGGGRTWLARDRARDRLVVLKEPLERWQQEPAAREAVLREARLAAKVRHPHVVHIEEVLEGKGSPIIVMEYLEGGSVADVLRARGSLPWKEAVPLMVDVLSGVEAAHAAGVVHRDVKPANVLLTREGVAKIADFGVAVAASGSAGSQKTMVMDMGAGAATVAGTLAYMAPEVRSGASRGDRRSDVYACAVLLHELLHGAPPGVASPAILRRDVPEALSALVARGLAERPEDRFPTARAFGEALARVAAE